MFAALAVSASHPAVAAWFGVATAGVAAAVVAMAWSVNVRQIRLAEHLARRQFLVTGEVAEQTRGADGVGADIAGMTSAGEIRAGAAPAGATRVTAARAGATRAGAARAEVNSAGMNGIAADIDAAAQGKLDAAAQRKLDAAAREKLEAAARGAAEEVARGRAEQIARSRADAALRGTPEDAARGRAGAAARGSGAGAAREPGEAAGRGAAAEATRGRAPGAARGRSVPAEVIEGPEQVVAGEQARYRVHSSGPHQVVTWAVGGGPVSHAPDPAHPDDLLLIADQPGDLTIIARVREGLTERRATKSVTAVPDVATATPPFTLRLFLHGWGLVVVAVLIVGFAGALDALGNFTSSDFIALAVPLAALLGVIAVARGHGETGGHKAAAKRHPLG